MVLSECVLLLVCLGKAVVVWQMDEETTTDNHNLLSLFPAAKNLSSFCLFTVQIIRSEALKQVIELERASFIFANQFSVSL